MDVPQRPLIVTADPALLDDLLRLATAAATEVAVAPDPEHALRSWRRAPLVVVGADLRGILGAADPPPHPRLVIASRAPDAPDLRITAPDRSEGGHTSHGPPAGVTTGPGPAVTGPKGSGPKGSGRRGSGRRGSGLDDGSPLYLLPRDESLLVELFAVVGESRPAPTVSVIGGRGGAGASLLTVALALAGERAGRSTALLDADPLGCGPDIYLGCDHTPQSPRTGWNDLVNQRSRTPWRALRDGLPHAGLVDVLTWARGTGGQGTSLPVGAARSVLASARRGSDLVVIDLPRSFDAATRVFLNHSDLVLLVVPADVYAVVSAARMIEALRQETDRLRLVVRGSHGGLSTSVVTGSLGVDLDADLPPEPGLSRALTVGEVPARHPRSPLARYADRVVGTFSGLREAG
ncbi:septum site-determining protein Ssd [Nocardiopsis listeri]|uniref:septum site-determining protein Ssd n=1 Tax=Nocardiopsis listeri TaxID=53440 RepID=UPI00082AE991|nr:septum site-determining protein Ssd [Nocardiopsis listeri]